MASQLFDTHYAGLKWGEFSAEGFKRPVCGAIFRPGQAVCGLPLGGIGTGCMDLNTEGTLGYCSIFNSFVPPRKLDAPFLALEIGGKVWVLAKQAIAGTEPAHEICYWGHYPVADLEFETSAPVGVGLRAWSPFLPGDSIGSNTPGAVFEVRLRNPTKTVQRGSMAFAFPGPTSRECGEDIFQHTPLKGPLKGISVKTAKGIGYVLAALGEAMPRTGGYLCAASGDWGRIGRNLPQASEKDAGATVAVDFELPPHTERTLRFVLAWYHPRWIGTAYRHYLHAYSTRFAGPEEVAGFLASRHDGLLKRILSWQEAIYAETGLPVWLRDQMVNILHIFSEDSFWASNSVPREDWCVPNGIFGVTESPRSVPHVAIPSDWYGSLPLILFFPDLMASLLRGYAHFQLPNGEIPLGVGWGADLGAPIYHFLHTVNSAVYVDLVGRMWQRGKNTAILAEFYPSVKKAVEYTKSLDRDGDGLLDLEPDPTGNQFYGDWHWHGTSVHTNGFWLPILKLAELMAEAAGDRSFADACRAWHQEGQDSLDDLWAGNSYLLYRDKATGRQSDTILANQLTGQWLSYLHGLPLMFTAERTETVLKTIAELHVPKSRWGIYNGLRPDGTIDPSGKPQSIISFPAENMCVAITYIYSGNLALGEQLAKNIMENIVLRQGAGWDMPNHVNPETGEITFGTDFYQMVILWGLPLALSGQDLAAASEAGHLADRILRAAAGTS